MNYVLGEGSAGYHQKIRLLLCPDGNSIDKKVAFSTLNSSLHQFGGPLSKIDLTTEQGMSDFQGIVRSPSINEAYKDSTIRMQISVIRACINVLCFIDKPIVSIVDYDRVLADRIHKTQFDKLAYTYYLAEQNN